MTDYDELVEKVAEWFLGYLLWEKDMDYPDFWVDTREDTKDDYRKVIRSLLQTHTKTVRLAVVKVKGKLPENPYQEHTFQSMISSHNWSNDCKSCVYNDAQQDMLSAHFVQEVKSER